MPKVSVLCNTYNHEKYISECLESFLAQQTTFEVEYLIHDDASTDQTTAILLDYQQRYPGRFKMVFQHQNQFSLGISIIDLNLTRATGDFVAVCDGDDYWSDPLKLQRQVDYMEAHPECSLHVHAYRVILEKDPSLHLDRYYAPVERDVPLRELLKTKTTPFAHSSFLFRRKDADYGPVFRRLGYADLPRLIYSATVGQVHYSPILSSVYRTGVPQSYVIRNTAIRSSALHQLERRINFYTGLKSLLPQEAEIIQPILDELNLFLAAKSGNLQNFLKALRQPGFPLTLRQLLILWGDFCVPTLTHALRRYRRLHNLPGGVR